MSVLVGDVALLSMTALAVCVGCLVPNRWLPPLPNDKFMHFASYAVLSILALRIAEGWLQSVLWLGGLLVAGWMIECLQSLVPDRCFCWRDLAANAAGIAFTAIGALLLAL